MKRATISNVLSLLFWLIVASSFSLAQADNTVSSRDAIESSGKVPEYFTLPPLREQAAIQDSWTKERRARIPKILQKYKVDAWLVCITLPTYPPT